MFHSLSSNYCNKQVRLDCVYLVLPAHLEVYDHSEHKDSGDEVHEVGQVLSVEGLSQGTHLVCAGGQEMEKSNDSPLKLSTWISNRSHRVSHYSTNEDL